MPLAFTEESVAMLSSVLRSKRAAQVNIEIDEQPCTGINSEDIDLRAASELFSSLLHKLTLSISKSLGLLLCQSAWVCGRRIRGRQELETRALLTRNQ